MTPNDVPVMSADETWRHVEAERSAFAELVESASEQQLDTPSLCEGWRVRDVAGHIAWISLSRVPEIAQAFILGGLRIDKVMSEQAVRSGSIPTERLVAQLRAGATMRNATPGFPPIGYLADVVVHQFDARRPLALAHDLPEERLVAVLHHAVGTNRFTGAKRRVRGLRLVATDVDFDRGAGLEVRGPGEALLLAAVGRPAGLADLAGDGVAVLGSRP